MFAKDISDKRLLFKIYKEFLKVNNKKTNNPIKKWTRDLNRRLTEDDKHMANKHVKRCSTSYVNRKKQIKIIKAHWLEWSKSRILTTSIADKDVEQRELSLVLVGMQNGTATLEDNVVFLTKLNILVRYYPAIMVLGFYAKELQT